MKAIAFANRLARDLSEKSLADLTADVKQELLDAINGALQRLNALSPHESRIVPVSIPIAAPATVSVGVVNGSYDVTVATFTADQCYRTIRIAGDDVDNAIVGTSTLFHPYSGTTGTVSATIYADAIAIPEPYSELVGNPLIIETRDELFPGAPQSWITKNVARPEYYWMDANARNQNPPAPMVLRLDTLPDQAYRLECKAILGSAKVTFSDLLVPGIDVPIRDEHVESYLLPIARGLLSTSGLWRDKETKATAAKAGEVAESRYAMLVPRTFSTPRNIVRTKYGF